MVQPAPEVACTTAQRRSPVCPSSPVLVCEEIGRQGFLRLYVCGLNLTQWAARPSRCGPRGS